CPDLRLPDHVLIILRPVPGPVGCPAEYWTNCPTFSSSVICRRSASTFFSELGPDKLARTCVSGATKGEVFVCASAGWLNIKTSATIEERCSSEVTFGTLPCFDWILKPTAFECPEQAISQLDL